MGKSNLVEKLGLTELNEKIKAGDIDSLISPELLEIVTNGKDASGEDPKKWAKRLSKQITHFFD